MNQLHLIGYVTLDLELQSRNATTVTHLRLAVRRPSNRQETDFFRITVFGKLAETCHRFVGKGSMVAVTAELRNNFWSDADGNKHYDLDLVGQSVTFLSQPTRTS